MESKELKTKRVRESELLKPGDTVTVGRIVYRVKSALSRNRFVIQLEHIKEGPYGERKAYEIPRAGTPI